MNLPSIWSTGEFYQRNCAGFPDSKIFAVASVCLCVCGCLYVCVRACVCVRTCAANIWSENNVCVYFGAQTKYNKLHSQSCICVCEVTKSISFCIQSGRLEKIKTIFLIKSKWNNNHWLNCVCYWRNDSNKRKIIRNWNYFWVNNAQHVAVFVDLIRASHISTRLKSRNSRHSQLHYPISQSNKQYLLCTRPGISSNRPINSP